MAIFIAEVRPATRALVFSSRAPGLAGVAQPVEQNAIRPGDFAQQDRTLFGCRPAGELRRRFEHAAHCVP
ncbi:MAG: hypothetical protein U0992_20485 [Planctomycetaceae bacterium]